MSVSRFLGCRAATLAVTAALLPFLSACAAETAAPVQEHAAVSIDSVEAADRALAEVTQQRAAVEARYAAEERACYDKFFVSSCLNDAKERRRVELQPLRDTENEANLYKRRARAEERDQALAEKRAQEESEQAQREQRSREAEERSAKAAAKDSQPQQPRQAPPGPDRVAQHELKLKRIREEEAAKAQERADNVAAYQRKVEEARAHEADVARRKAEKEREEKERAGKQDAPASSQ